MVFVTVVIILQPNTALEFFFNKIVKLVIKLAFKWVEHKAKLVLEKRRCASLIMHQKKCDHISKIEDAFYEVVRMAFGISSRKAVDFPT